MLIASVFRSALRLLGVALFALSFPAVRAAVTASASDGFNPNVHGGNVYSVLVQPDGKILLAGKFDFIQPNGGSVATAHNNIARVLPDGTNDSTFTSDVNGEIDVMLLQPDGKIIIGGKFTKVEGVTRNHVARLNPSGTLDTTFDPNTSGSVTGVSALDTSEVTALALQSDGKVLVGGGFSKVTSAGVTRRGLARFNADGTLDPTLVDIAANGYVLAIAVQSDGAIVIGGGFTSLADNATAFNRIARVSATGALDTSFNPNADGAINAIVIQPDGRIIIGGAFATLTPNGSSTAEANHPRLARLETTGLTDTSFAPSPDGPVHVLKRQADGRVLIGGRFSSTGAGGGAFATRILPDGTLDITFYPTPNLAVYAYDVQPDGSVIMGGSFTTLAGHGASTVVRNHIARVSTVGGLDADFRPDVNGRLRRVAVDAKGRVLIGGTFTSVAGETHNSLVRMKADGTIDSDFKPSINGYVDLIQPLANGQIMIGGGFTYVNSTPRSYIARLNEDGTTDIGFDAQPNSNVVGLAQQGDKFIIAGNFTTLSPWETTEPITRVCLARLNADGTVDTAFTAQAYSSVSGFFMQSDGKFIITGSFTSVLGNGAKTQTSRYHIARFNADGTVDTTFTPATDGIVYACAFQSDGMVLVGSFSQFAGTGDTTSLTRHNVARLKTDGTLDTTFDPSTGDLVQTILPLSDGSFVLGGYFTTLTPNSSNVGTTYNRNYIARIGKDGALDQTFDLGLDLLAGNIVNTLALSSSGKIIVGGAFTSLKNSTVARNRIAQVALDGSVDTSFNPDLSAAQGASIEAITEQTDGGVLLAGNFASLSGTGSANLAHFYSDSTPDAGFYPNVDGSSGKVHTIAQLPTRGETVATQRSGFGWLESNGELRTGIAKGTDPTAFAGIRAIAVQPDGKVLVAASVTRPATTDNPSGTPDYILRFNADGSVDTAFEPLIGSTVLVIKPQSDGKILLGGSFTTAGLSSSSTRNYMVRLNADGTVDTSFDPNFSSSVLAIEIQSDGKILVGGSFTGLAPNSQTTSTLRAYICRLNADGTVDTAFNPTANSTVRAISIRPDGKILIGGLFTTLQPGATGTEVERKGLALLNADGTLDSTDFALNSTVTGLFNQADNKVIVMGTFSSIRGQTRNYLARLNADLTIDTAFNPNPGGEVSAVALQTDGKILIGGAFTAIQPNDSSYDVTVATPRRYAARLNTDGTLDPSFNPMFDSTVSCLAVYPDGSILAGGSFSSIQPNGSLIVGGVFSKISGVNVKNLALLSGDGSVSATFLPNPDGAVYATQVLTDGRFLVGGAFTNLSGTAVKRLARFTAANTLDTTFKPAIDDEVHALALQPDGQLLVGGKFKNVGGLAHAYLARIDANGNIDNSFNPSLTGDVTAIAVQKDKRILVLSAGSGVRSIVSRLNADGSADSTFAPINAGSALISAMLLQTDGKIVLGGAFKSGAPLSVSGAAAKNYLARLNADGTFDATLTAEPSGPVTALMLSPTGKLTLGGSFNAVDGLPRFGLARLAPTTPVVSSFSANAERTTLIWTRSGPGPELTGVVFKGSVDGATWTTIGNGTRVDGSSNWALGGLGLPANTDYYVRVFGVTTGSSQGSSGIVESRGHVRLSALPVVTSATAVNATVGSSFLYAISTNGATTSYAASGLPAGLTLNTQTGVITGKPTQAGSYSVTLTVTNSLGSTSTAITIFVALPDGSIPTSRLGNISVLGDVSSSNPIITGFVLSGDTSSQTVLVRAVGPGLTKVGVTGVLASPHLKLMNAGGTVKEADAWGGVSSVATAALALGANPPLDAASTDAAFLITLAPGAYTFHVTDNGTSGGIALAEIYDASSSASAKSTRVVNISARGVVNGYTLLVGGFVIIGDQPKKVLIRGVGPGLAAQGVTGVLANPKLELVRNVGGTNTLIARNDNWATADTADAAYPAATAAAISAAATKTGAFALTTSDAAVLVTLPPGVYSAQVSAVGSLEGAAMVEVYDAD